MKEGNGGSLTEGVSTKSTITQKEPRQSGQGERPAKGSGTTIGGNGSGDKGCK